MRGSHRHPCGPGLRLLGTLSLVSVPAFASGARSSPAQVDLPTSASAPATATAADCTKTTYCLTLPVTAGGEVTATALKDTIVCPPTCQLGYNAQICTGAGTRTSSCGYSLTLKESPDAGYAFAGWGGDCGKSGSSGTCASPPARSVPAGSTEAWAHFVLQNQPIRRLRLTITWYWPDGRLLGSVVMSNRPSLVSFLRSNVALSTGGWRAELRAGGRVVSELLVRVH